MSLRNNLALSDSGFIFDPGSGDSFSVNPIGLEIIHLLKSGKSHKEIQNHLVRNYSVESEIAGRDLEDFSGMLRQYNLLDEDETKED